MADSTFNIKLIALDDQSKSGPEPHLIVALTSPAGVKAAEIGRTAAGQRPLSEDPRRDAGVADTGVSVGYFLFGG